MKKVLAFCLFLIATTGFADDRREIRIDEEKDWILITQQPDNIRIVIFVHGFTGDYKKTWGKFPDLIANDEQLDHFDILLWGYPSQKFGRNPKIERIGAALKTEIDHLPSRYREVVLVGHSMGGLVVRAYVVNALLDGRGHDLNKIRKVVLFGVPNDGIDKADYVPAFINAQVADMKTASDFIIELRKQWINRVYRPNKIDEYHRRIPSLAVVGLEDRFVPEASVKAFFDEYETTRGDHTEMVKPDSKNHLSFKIVKRQLLSVAPKPFISNIDNLNSALRDIRVTLLRKEEFLIPAIDRFLLNPNKKNWKIVQQNAEANLKQALAGVENSLLYDAENTNKFFRLVNTAKKKNQSIFGSA